MVGLKHKRLQLVGECKWTKGEMPPSVLEDLRTYKIPAITRSKDIKAPGREPRILLFARSGFTGALRRVAADDDNIELIDADALVEELACEE